MMTHLRSLLHSKLRVSQLGPEDFVESKYFFSPASHSKSEHNFRSSGQDDNISDNDDLEAFSRFFLMR